MKLFRRVLYWFVYLAVVALVLMAIIGSGAHRAQGSERMRRRRGPRRRPRSLPDQPEPTREESVGAVERPALLMRFKNQQQKDAMVTTLRAAIELIGNLFPGVRYIALQDYKTLNETPIELRMRLAEAEAGEVES